MHESTIRSYFETKLKVWADAQTPQIKIAYEGVPFTKPERDPYLEVNLIPSYTNLADLKGVRIREGGIFQINVVVVDGAGMKKAQELAASIAQLFPVVPKTSAVSVESPPHIARPFINSDGRRSLPISITYRLES